MKSLYLEIDFFTVLIPVLFSFHPKIKFYKQWKVFLLSSITVALIFLIWDALFTDLGVWGFNPRYVLSIYIYNMPIEEILFFLCIPFSSVFTYYCLDKFYKLQWNQKAESIFIALLSLALLIIGIIFFTRLYTSVTFISTAVICFYLQFINKWKGIGKVVMVYVVLLIPFFIVNGILTGTGIKEPVVWYNNLQITGVRLLTIPLEDFIYGFELFLLNIYVFYLIKERFSKT